MFPSRYFAPRHFAARYWARGAGLTPPTPDPEVVSSGQYYPYATRLWPEAERRREEELVLAAPYVPA